MAISGKHGSYQLLWSLTDILAARKRRSLNRSRLAFLGNQRIRPDLIEPRLNVHEKYCTVGRWLGWFGADVTCFDLNGKDGAVVADFREPLPTKYDGQFHGVTNFGTTEHVVGEQYNVFESIHRITAPGYFMAHSVPASGGCHKHGEWKYTTKWFADLAADAGYDVIDLFTVGVDERCGYVNCLFQKCEIANSPFIGRDKWRDPPRA